MDYYILRSDGAYCSYGGMTQSQITTMLSAQGLTCTFISQASFKAALASFGN